MSVKPSLTKLIAAAALMASFGAMALAQGHGGRGMGPGPDMPGFGGRHAEQMLEMVDASDAQRSQIHQIMDAARKDLQGQHDALRKIREQQMGLFTAPNIDAAAIESLRQQAQTLHEQRSKRMSQALVDAARVLSPEQRAKLAERMKKMRVRFEERMEQRQKPSGR